MNRITAIDVHVAGEPLRVVIQGIPEPEGDTILRKRRFCQEHYDHLRKVVMWEPRGHADMYGCLLVSPSHPEADYGVLFFHNEGYSTMCGHGIIGLVTVLLHQGLHPKSEPATIIRFDTPSGLVTAKASIKRGTVQAVSFRNVPSFVADRDQFIEIPGFKPIQYDVAFGGAFYAFCQADKLGIALHPTEARNLKNLGRMMKQAIMNNRTIGHPTESELGFLYGTIFVGPPQTGKGHVRQVCIFADGALDRSPTGTGASAHLALVHAKGQIAVEQSLQFESILGTLFGGKIVEETTYGGMPAIIPEVEGRAFITGHHEFFIDPDDPLQEGFLL